MIVIQGRGVSAGIVQGRLHCFHRVGAAAVKRAGADPTEEAQAAGAATFNYGTFISNIINFVIMAFVVFMFVRGMNKLKKEEKPAPVTKKKCPFCKTEIELEATRCPHCTSELIEEAPTE